MNPEERDAMAAEWVLGTLPDGDRAEAARLLAADPAFRAAVEAWEDRLAPLDAATEPVEPPAALWPRVQAAIGPAAGPVLVADTGARLADSAGPTDDVTELTRRLVRWRRISLGTMALAAGLAAVVAVERLPQWLGPEPVPGARYVAVVNRDASLPALIVDVDTAAGIVTVRPVAAEQPADKSLELWVIPDGEKPRSLGLVDPRDAVIRIGAEKSGPIPEKGVFAVTVEPPGGSPSGDPTGPVVYSGPLLRTE
jgi:anti-sigma-K factor RskA